MPKQVAAPLPRVPVRRILATLAEMYPRVGTALRFRNPFELLVATILSAQCTDKTVNAVTPALFAAYPDARSLAAADPRDVESLISRCGLYRTKARNLVAAARLLVERHGGEVPARMEDLLALPGVGRKTANVVLAAGFGLPGLAVDTHVFRVANRLGLARARTPEQAEMQLRRRIPRQQWAETHHRLIWHGRLVCHARSPDCAACPLQPYCLEGRARVGPARPRTRRSAASAGPS
jgi:endonuclease-3